MKRIIHLLALTSLFAVAIPAGARAVEPEAVLERRMRLFLFAHHGPPSAEVFVASVPDARARLMRMANDPATNAFTRDRALIALAGFGGEDVRVLYDRVLADHTVSKIARVHVLGSYARAFPKAARAVLERAREEAVEPELRAVAEASLRRLDSALNSSVNSADRPATPESRR